MSIVVDVFRLHIPRRIESLGCKNKRHLLTRLELLAKLVREGDGLFEECPAPLPFAPLLDWLFDQVCLSEILAIVYRNIDSKREVQHGEQKLDVRIPPSHQ